ncbi:hypothetical protein [Streptomyces catenulae]|uniref:Uncharacterized protein n=1 Tax=Streptomyces catenulae TaxID=66875 RepID=A0ABV2YX23_9ACTN|nr:hypothetical protein [Streptomyces catenulae]
MADLTRTAETVAYYRALDEHATARHHFRHADEDGGLWHFEAVHDRGELVVIKQAELTPTGQLHRYDWQHLEDDHGFLTDQPIDLEADPVEAIPAEEFQRVWTR